ncbi:MAG: DUF4394 domain-containing protein [Thermoleophilaceae bacterium]|nr:DUF4394 domain-containing protein [Thermoleophilaceae bacterium]
MKTKALGAALAVVALSPASATAAESLIGISGKSDLVTFSSATPSGIAKKPVTGLQPGESIVGIDVRPADNLLYGLGSTGRLYAIDPARGGVTPVGAGPFGALSGTEFGFDFNPTVDRIRVTSDVEQNLRLNPSTGALANTDGGLAYTAGDPGAGSDPKVIGAGYTNSVAGATMTQLFDIDSGRDALVLQDPPNAGGLKTVGALGLAVQDTGGFDIAPTTQIGWAALRKDGANDAELFQIDLLTGKATSRGRIGGPDPVRALAALGTAQADATAPAGRLSVRASRNLRTLRSKGVSFSVRCNEACTARATVKLGGTTLGTARSTTDLAATVSGRARFTSRGRRALLGRSSARISVTVRVTDPAGNSRTLRRSVSAR